MRGKTIAVTAVLFLVSIVAGAALAQQVMLPPNPATWQYQQQLPLLSAAGGKIATVSGTGPLTIHMCEFKANILPPGAVAGYAGTWVWGYLAEAGGQTTCAGLVDYYYDGFANGISGPLDTYIGPVVLAERGTATKITFLNYLGNTAGSQLTFWKDSTDQTLHWADPLGGETNACAQDAMDNPGILPVNSACASNYLGPIPAVVHIHGGDVPPELDGGPDAWFTNASTKRGHGYYTSQVAGDVTPANGAIYRYPNRQEAAPIWFHDHVLGATRLNVYAGLAGAYLISDPAQTLPAGLHPRGLSYAPAISLDVVTVPLVIQDRIFDTTGQLFFQAGAAGGVLWATNPDHPYWSPEFVGDTIVVNGKVWPYLDVEPKRYRFLFVNGSNARSYEMNIIDPLKIAVPPNMWVIATDGGYLDKPVLAKKLVMMPGERYEVIIDFAGVPNNTKLVIKNTAKTPFPGGGAAGGATTGQIMQFRVGACASNKCGANDTSFNPAAPGAIIRATGEKIVRLPGTPGGPAIVTAATSAQNVQKTRQLTLNEVMGMPVGVVDPVLGLPYPGGPLEILVNNTKWSGESARNTCLTATGKCLISGTTSCTTNEDCNDFTPISVGGVTTYYSELPNEGDTEVWEIVNITADAHPIHLHLVQFQIINRQAINTAAYNAAFPAVPGDPMCTGGVFCPGFGPPLHYTTGNARALGGNPDIAAVGNNLKPLYLSSKAAPPDPNEAGWKDTVIMYPGQVTRIAVRWAPTHLAVQTTGNLGSLYFPFDPSNSNNHGYVWHCHIIDHEDNEMMRPTSVVLNPLAPAPASRDLKIGTHY